MSQGAVFNLLVRDPRNDQYLVATDLLHARLLKIGRERAALGKKITAPTYGDVECTHYNFLASSFRPYVAVASEYTRVQPTGATAKIIPGGSTIEFAFPAYGAYTSDIVLHVRLPAIGNKAAYDAGAAPTLTTPLLRYCALPGLRLVRSVEFLSDSFSIDKYTADDAVMWSKFFVRPEARTAWARCHGQQAARKASFTSNNFSTTFDYNEGIQTPKLYHAATELFVPIHLWFCQDPSQALFNGLFPNTQRRVRIELAGLELLVQALVPDTVAQPVQPPDNVILATPVAAVPGTALEGGYTLAALPFASLAVDYALYVNGLYVNPEIQEIAAARSNFSLIRVHRQMVRQLLHSQDSILLDGLKFPAEYFLAGIRSRTNVNSFTGWHLMGASAVRLPVERLFVPAVVWNTALSVTQLVAREAVDVTSYDNIVATLGLAAHGIDIFGDSPSTFYNAYLPGKYPLTATVTAPDDEAALLVPLCLFPGRDQPSGYFNLSAAREMYLRYRLKDEYASAASDCELVISMSAINFLVTRGDSISLEYTL